MTVIPFTYRPGRSWPGGPRPWVAPIVVSGFLASPTGRSGTFTGFFRLERCAWAAGHLTVAGVVTGELRDADGSLFGLGARRTRVSAEVVDDTRPELVLRLGPLEVDLLGFLVTVEERTVDLAGHCCGASGEP